MNVFFFSISVFYSQCGVLFHFFLKKLTDTEDILVLILRAHRTCSYVYKPPQATTMGFFDEVLNKQKKKKEEEKTAASAASVSGSPGLLPFLLKAVGIAAVSYFAKQFWVSLADIHIYR